MCLSNFEVGGFCLVNDPSFTVIAFGAFNFTFCSAYGCSYAACFRSVHSVKSEFKGFIYAATVAVTPIDGFDNDCLVR